MAGSETWKERCPHTPPCALPDECDTRSTLSPPPHLEGVAFTVRLERVAPIYPPNSPSSRWHFSVLLTVSGKGRVAEGTRFTRQGALDAALTWVDSQLRQVRG